MLCPAINKECVLGECTTCKSVQLDCVDCPIKTECFSNRQSFRRSCTNYSAYYDIVDFHKNKCKKLKCIYFKEDMILKYMPVLFEGYLPK